MSPVRGSRRGELSGESSRGRTGRVAGSGARSRAGDEGRSASEGPGAVTVEAGFNAPPPLLQLPNLGRQGRLQFKAAQHPRFNHKFTTGGNKFSPTSFSLNSEWGAGGFTGMPLASASALCLCLPRRLAAWPLRARASAAAMVMMAAAGLAGATQLLRCTTFVASRSTSSI